MARKVLLFLTVFIGICKKCYAEDYKRTVIKKLCEVGTIAF